MKALREGTLEHQFDDTWIVSKYDEWPFYREHFQTKCSTNKGVDFLARDPKAILWLIELKDYRVHSRMKSLELAEEVAIKVRDSLAGIFAAAKWQGDHAQSDEAKHHLETKKLRVVLHLEQPAQHSKLFPRKFELTNLQEKLKQLVRAVDAHPLVVELATSQDLPWTAVSVRRR